MIGKFLFKNIKHLHFQVSKSYLAKNIIIPSHQNYSSILSNPIPNLPNDPKIIVIGGGIVGVSTAYNILQNTNNNVVLLEKNPFVANETSNNNGGIFGTEYNIVWVSRKIPKHFISSILIRDYPFKFNIRALLEPNMMSWIFNMFISIRNDEKNLDVIDQLAQLSKKQFDELIKEIPKEKFDSCAEGLISIYKNKKDLEKESYFYNKKKNKGFDVQMLSKSEILQKEPLLNQSLNEFESGALWPIETNVDTVKLTNEMLNLCKRKFKDKLQVLTQTNVEKFIFEQNNAKKIVGVQTNKGHIFSDKIVVSAGIESIELLSLLEEKILLAPVKGYTMSVHLSDNKKHVNTIVSDEKNRMSFSQIGDKIRIAAFAEFRGRDLLPEKKRIDQIKKLLFNYIGIYPDNQLSFWVGNRHVTPDDVPYISKSNKFENLFINTGHGSKGTTLALGAGKLISEIINNDKNCSINIDSFKINRFF